MYFNHLTLNTGHTRKSYAFEVNPAVLEETKEIYLKSTKGGYTLNFDEGDYFIETTAGKKFGNITTISYIKEGKKIPFLVTASSRESMNVFNMFVDTFEVNVTPPEPPYIIDFIISADIPPRETWEWTGDLTRCLAWASIAE